MRSIADGLKNRVGATKPSKVTNGRQYWVGQFLEALEAQRDPKYKPLTAARVAMLLSQLKTLAELEGFYEECKQSSHFSKHFWWSCNPKKH